MSNANREQKRAEFQQKLAQYPAWDREEQIRKNQGAIETIQDWLNKEVSQEEEAARHKHYEIFEETISGNLTESENC